MRRQRNREKRMPLGQVGRWRLRGYDRFEERWYAIPGSFDSEEDAFIAALREGSSCNTTILEDGKNQTAGIEEAFELIFLVSPDGGCRLVHRDLLN